MSTTTIPAAARDYLKSVRKGLADLPPEDAEEVLQDLEAHVAELGEIDPATELGLRTTSSKNSAPVPVPTSTAVPAEEAPVETTVTEPPTTTEGASNRVAHRTRSSEPAPHGGTLAAL